eukprot:COSAG02_NODE_8975_length_2376_cov_3.305226_2_plen_49_part_00
MDGAEAPLDKKAVKEAAKAAKAAEKEAAKIAKQEVRDPDSGSRFLWGG